jgi:membrane-associated protein
MSIRGPSGRLASAAVLSPTHLLNDFGALGVLVILFAETGILLGIVLPGDSLLFTAGLLCSTTERVGGHNLHLQLPVVVVAAVVGAVLGAQVGYLIGRKLGPALFRRPDSRLFKQEYVERTRTYLEKYGPAKAVFLARFVPIVRTLMNPLVGVTEMDARVFTLSNVAGGVIWGAGVTVAGYFLGKSIPNVDHYLLPIIAFIILLSLLPVANELRKARGEKRSRVA